MEKEIIYALIASIMLSLTQFIWMNFLYERKRIETWPKKLFLKQFILLNVVTFGLSPILFLIFHFDEILEERYFRMLPYFLSIVIYFIPLMILILIVEKYCDKSYKKS